MPLSGHSFVTLGLYYKCAVLEGRVTCCAFFFCLIIWQINLHGWGTRWFSLLSSVWAFSQHTNCLKKPHSISDGHSCYSSLLDISGKDSREINSDFSSTSISYSFAQMKKYGQVKRKSSWIRKVLSLVMMWYKET